MSLLWSSDGGDGSVELRQWRYDTRSRRARVYSGVSHTTAQREWFS